jgi:hypothetical protein
MVMASWLSIYSTSFVRRPVEAGAPVLSCGAPAVAFLAIKPSIFLSIYTSIDL